MEESNVGSKKQVSKETNKQTKKKICPRITGYQNHRGRQGLPSHKASVSLNASGRKSTAVPNVPPSLCPTQSPPLKFCHSPGQQAVKDSTAVLTGLMPTQRANFPGQVREVATAQKEAL